jgi:protein disulfide isomerase family A protein 3
MCGTVVAAGIAKYLKAQVGPSSRELSSVADFEDFISKDDVAVVGFFEKETDLKGAFLKLADRLREKVRFGHSTTKAVLEKAGQK